MFLVKTVILCDVCLTVGPNFSPVGENGEVKLPLNWRNEDSVTVCSDTCFARRTEKITYETNNEILQQIYNAFQLKETAVDCNYEIICIAVNRSQNCLKSIKRATRYYDILPPGWTHPTTYEKYYNSQYYCDKGICPNCLEQAIQDRKSDKVPIHITKIMLDKKEI